MIPIKDKYKIIRYGPTLEDQIRIYKTKKSIRGAADRGVESLRFQALSEDSGFKSYPSRLEVYLVKKRGAIDNNYGRQ